MMISCSRPSERVLQCRINRQHREFEEWIVDCPGEESIQVSLCTLDSLCVKQHHPADQTAEQSCFFLDFRQSFPLYKG